MLQGATPVRLIYPNGLALDDKGDLYISDIGSHAVLKLDRQGGLTVIAGTGEAGYSGDGGPAVKARLHAPHDLAFDSEGRLVMLLGRKADLRTVPDLSRYFRDEVVREQTDLAYAAS